MEQAPLAQKKVITKMFKKRFVQVLLFILIIIAALGIWQKDNLIAYYNAQRYSSEELQEQVEEIREKADQAIQEKYPELKVPHLSVEEEEKLLKGELSAEEISKKYQNELANNNDDVSENTSHNVNVGNESEEQSSAKSQAEDSVVQTEAKTTNKSDNSSKKSTNTNNPSIKENSNSEEKVVAEAMGKLYSIQAKYLSKVGGLERSALADYNNGKGMSKSELASKYGSIAGGYESSCDAEVEAVLADLDSQLAKLAGDRSVVNTLRESYYAEKQSKKAYYLSKIK